MGLYNNRDEKNDEVRRPFPIRGHNLKRTIPALSLVGFPGVTFTLILPIKPARDSAIVTGTISRNKTVKGSPLPRKGERALLTVFLF